MAYLIKEDEVETEFIISTKEENVPEEGKDQIKVKQLVLVKEEAVEEDVIVNFKPKEAEEVQIPKNESSAEVTAKKLVLVIQKSQEEEVSFNPST